jgi:cell division protein FtsW
VAVAPARRAWRPEAARSLVVAYYLVTVSTCLLVGIGFVMVVSSQSYSSLLGERNPALQVLTQAAYIAGGAIVAFVLARLPRRWWQGLALIAFVSTCALQVLVQTGLGVAVNGNKNWVQLGPLQFQPGELLKFGLAVWLGWVLATKARRLDDWRELTVPALISIAVAGGLVVWGHDVGSASILAILSLGALVVAGVPWRKLAVLGVLAAIVGAGLILGSDTRRARVEALFHPDQADKQGAAYQITQAHYALGEGGLFGAGLGSSHEKWGFLSEAETDFIFAILGEEFGLVGCAVVIILFGVLAVGLFHIVALHPDRFAQVTTGAVACWILGEAIINIGMVVGLLPVVGVPLPFVSRGGTALISCLAAIGLVVGLVRGDPDIGPALRAGGGLLRRTASVLGLSRRVR